jgi:hypothetical protein
VTGTVTIDAVSGTLTGTASACNYTGNATQRAGNVNAYNLTINYGVGCTTNATVTGAAYYDISANRLYAGALNSNSSVGYVFVGSK